MELAERKAELMQTDTVVETERVNGRHSQALHDNPVKSV
jgi:hypothetical protein